MLRDLPWTQLIEVRVTFPDGKTHTSRRGIVIE